MTVRTLVLTLLSVLALACNDEVTRTQLTFRLNAGPSVRTSIETLRVTVRSSTNGDQTVNFGKADLRDWPVEIVVLPEAGNQSDDSVSLIATALGAGGTVLATQTTRAAFKPERVTTVDVALGADAVNPGRDLDGGEDVEPGQDAGPEPQEDAGEPAAKNCETDSKIKCNDDNRCNGEETCNPRSSNADEQGCVPSDSPVTCAKDMTCDSNTGECSSCVQKPDGDGDGASSLACGGLDCNDNDNGVAPGKPEKCNNRDDDCDGTRDGPKADADCAASAPVGGTASCVSGMCVGACNDKTHQITKGMCAPVPAACPAVNPCAPGACNAGTPTYTCTCPAGFRTGAGMTRCAPIGVPTRTIGFEVTCDGMGTPGLFLGETKRIASDLYAACGVNSITSGAPTVDVELVRPLPLLTQIDGITKDTALEVPARRAMAGTPASAELAVGFSQPVTELSVDILDIDNLPGLKVTVLAGAAKAINVVIPPPAVGTKRTRVRYLDPAVPVDQMTISYAASDRLFIDELSYRVGGCGDKVMEGAETCDDGNTVQCDGCDNACGISPAGCFASGTCYAGGALTADSCRLCDLTAKAPAGGDVPLSKSPTAPASCGN